MNDKPKRFSFLRALETEPQPPTIAEIGVTTPYRQELTEQNVVNLEDARKNLIDSEQQDAAA